ncbi:MAG: hypothetical protein J6S73_07725, partial [Lentisphaeria bacterium]|nr:hypothetical protein [Lentisphaeria bacterium]
PSLLALWCNGELLAAVDAGCFNWNTLLLIPFCLMPGGLLLIVGLQGARGIWGEWLRLSHIRYLLCFLSVEIFFVLWSDRGLLCFFPLAGLGAIAVAAYFRQGGTQRFFRWIMAFWGCFWLCIAAMCLLRFSGNWLWITLCILYGAALLIAAIRYGWRDVLMIFFLGMIPLLIQMQLFAVQEYIGWNFRI